MTDNLAQLPCPNCGSPISARLEQIVDVWQDPEAKQRLLSGRLNLVRCGVCGHQGQIATPLVYHDPEHELLLTYMPVEVGLSKDDQERVLGRLINQVVDRLPTEDRKGYLLQPQAVLTMQGMAERILQEDGISREDLQVQQAKARLVERMLQLDPDGIPAFVEEHDGDLDAVFFQLAALLVQSNNAPEDARNALVDRLNSVLTLSTYGKTLQRRETELRAAAESLRSAGEDLTREKLIGIFRDAPNEDRVAALVSLTRPALDYQFFSTLTEEIDRSEEADKDRLVQLRERVLTLTQEIDKEQEARVQEAARLLQTLLEAEDQEAALQRSLPAVDELFLNVLRSNIQAAEQTQDTETLSRMVELEARILDALRQSLPPGLQLAQQLMEIEDEEEARALLEGSPESLDEELMNVLISTAQRLLEAGNEEAAGRIRRLHRLALRIKMKNSLARAG